MANLPILANLSPPNLPRITMADTGYDPSSLPQISGLSAPSILDASNLPVTGESRKVPIAEPDQASQRAVPAGLKRPPPPIGATVNGYTYMGGDPRSRDPSVWRPATGDTFLNSLPLDDQKKTLIKAIANYEIPPGTQRGSIGSPEVQQLLALAKQYDPDFSATDYAIRQATRTDFSKGQYSKTVTALNTAIDHARTLADEAKGLNNGNLPVLNWVGNTWDRYVKGDPRQGMFEQTARNLGGEVVKAVTGGEGALEDRTRAAGDYSVDGSPAQQMGALANTVDLLKSKLDELDATYKRGMGDKRSVMELLSPSARKSWSYLSQQFQHNGQASGAPAGVDPKVWKYLTPQERALWQK